MVVVLLLPHPSAGYCWWWCRHLPLIRLCRCAGGGGGGVVVIGGEGEVAVGYDRGMRTGRKRERKRGDEGFGMLLLLLLVVVVVVVAAAAAAAAAAVVVVVVVAVVARRTI